MDHDPRDVLRAIVEQNGDCQDFATPAICKSCPLGQKVLNGRRVSCVEYLGLDFLDQKNEDEVNQIYKQAAEEELFELDLEDILE